MYSSTNVLPNTMRFCFVTTLNKTKNLSSDAAYDPFKALLIFLFLICRRKQTAYVRRLPD